MGKDIYDVCRYPDRSGHGYQIARFPIRCINKDGLVDTVQDSFGNVVKEGYLPSLLLANAVAYIEVDFKGIVVVIPHPADGVTPHIETVAVRKKYQENGLGTDLMSLVTGEFPKCHLRSKPIPERRRANDMYFELFGAPQQFKNFQNILYNGYFMEHSEAEVKKAIRYMRRRPDAFKKKP